MQALQSAPMTSGFAAITQIMRNIQREWCGYLSITPSDAEEILKFNTANRDIRKSVVRDLAAAMRRGEWKTTHQGISISKTHRLLDGQHRLLAIVESGITCLIQVTTGQPDENFQEIDRHSRRTMADSFHDSKMIMEPINLAARIIYGNSTTPAQVSTIRDILRPFVVPFADGVGRKKVFTSAPMILAAALSELAGGERERTYIRRTFTALLKSDFDDMSPAAKSFAKQTIDGIISPSKESGADLLARAFIVFDESRKNTGKIIVKDSHAAVERVRAELSKYLNF